MLKFIIINEQHSLMADQEGLLLENGFGPSAAVQVKVPAEGWTFDKMEELAEATVGLAEANESATVVFVSPVPALIAMLARVAGERPELLKVLIMHNDQRVAREVPDGKGGTKVIHTVAPDGWELV